MIFLPYKIDVELRRFPIFTLLIVISCLGLFSFQESSWERHSRSISDFCSSSLSSTVRDVIRRVNRNNLSCADFWLDLRKQDEPLKKIERYVADAILSDDWEDKEKEKQFYLNELKKEFEYFEVMVPSDLTASLAYYPKDPSLWQMFTSTFAHGSWAHVKGNLFFFFTFAAAIEVLIGSLIFLMVIGIMAITTSVSYSISVLGLQLAAPSVGLSGVVMGMLVMLGLLAPRVRIKCFLWFVIVFKVFRVPALFLALWFVAWDFYDMKFSRQSGVDYIAHVSGAVTGAVIALFYKFIKPSWLYKVT